MSTLNEQAQRRLTTSSQNHTSDSSGAFQLQDPQPEGPGIFFDSQKGYYYQQELRKQARRSGGFPLSNSSLNPDDQHRMTVKSNFSQISSEDTTIHTTGFGVAGISRKLFPANEQLTYAMKRMDQKKNYISSLSQLGLSNIDVLNAQPLNEIIHNTEDVIQSSYSMKYLGIVQGSMGVLSKRMMISPDNTRTKTNQTLKLEDSNITPQTPHFITNYALPKQLKPLRKPKDQSIYADKFRLEEWHASQLLRLQQHKKYAGLDITLKPKSNSTLPTDANIQSRQTAVDSQKEDSSPTRGSNMSRGTITSSDQKNQSYSRLLISLQEFPKPDRQAKYSIQAKQQAITENINDSRSNASSVFARISENQPKRLTRFLDSHAKFKRNGDQFHTTHLGFSQNSNLQDRFDNLMRNIQTSKQETSLFKPSQSNRKPTLKQMFM